MFLNLHPSPQLEAAMALEGYIEKAKPDALIPIYDKRYFKFIEEGLILAYAEKQEDFEKGLIKGQIPMKDVVEIKLKDTTSKKFHVSVEKRLYKLQAKSNEEASKWVEALRKIQAFAAYWSKEWEKALRDLNSEFVVEETYEDPNLRTEFYLLQPINFIKNTAKKVVMDGVVGKAVTVVKKAGELFSDVKPRTNQEYLKAKKFDEVLNLIDPNILRSRIKMGFLLRESKEMTGLRPVDSVMNSAHIHEILARKWCLLISSKPILLDEMAPGDDVTLNQGHIPLGLEYDTLYLFDEACDNSVKMDAIPLKDVVQVTMRKKVQNEILYRFVLDLGGHKYNLMCPSFSEMDQWLRAIQTSRAVITEYQHSTLSSLRNINCIIITKDGEDGEEHLRNKILEDYDKLTRGQNVVTPANALSIINTQEKVANEYINIINACLADRHQRIDIIKMYEEVYHENILNAFKNFFQRNAKDLPNNDIFEMIKFLSSYRNNLTVFGSSFSDTRIKEGVITLGETVARRALKTNMKFVNNILKNILNDKPELDTRGIFASQAPKDIFKILNECLNMPSFCHTEHFILTIIKTCCHTIEYFQNGIEALLKAAELTNEQLVMICNDMMTFLRDMKDEFMVQLQGLTTHSAEVIVKYFDDQALSKRFAMLGKKSEEKLGENIFGDIAVEVKNTKFKDLDLEEIYNKASEKVQQITDKIHPNYINKIPNILLQQLVAFYVQAFLRSLDKKDVKHEKVQELLETLKEAQESLKEISKQIAKESKVVVDVNKILNPIIEFEDLLTQKYTMLTLSVQKMKESYGDALKWPTVELLLRVRGDDISKEEQTELITSCKQVFKTTERTNANLDKFNVFRKVEQKSDSSVDNINGGFFKESSREFLEFKEKFSEAKTIEQPKLSLNGYLTVDTNFLKDVIGIIAGQNETRYFSISKEQMYCYKDKNSENALKTFNLKDAVQCRAEQDNAKFVLRINRNNKRMKDYKFIAENEHKRNHWVKVINDIMNLPSMSADMKIGVVDVNFYKSNASLFSETETMPSLQYEYIKPRKTVVLNVETNLSAASVNKEALNRKETLMLVPEEDKTSTTTHEVTLVEAMPKQSFCAVLCLKIGIFKTKNSYSPVK